MKAISKILHRGSALKEASRALILLHGRGGSADNMLSLAHRLVDHTFYVAAPQAVNHIWYPQSFMAEEMLNEPNLSLSVDSLKDLIEQIAEHIPTENVFIMGFSQGACLALEATSRFATRYAGIVAFTGGLIGKTLAVKKYHGDFAGTQVFISNGNNDPYIPLIRSQDSKEIMQKLGAHVTLKVYPGRPHTISADEINTVKSCFFSV